MSAKFFTHPTEGIGPRGLVLEKQTRTWTKLLGTQIERIYKGRPEDVLWHEARRATSFPGAKEVVVDEDADLEGFWAIRVLDAVQLNSVWELDGSQNDVPLAGSLMGIHLDYAFPGWPRYIEVKINEWFAAETAASRFDFTTIQASSLTENDQSTAATLNVDRQTLAQLNELATKYALAYITGQETFFQPRWIIRNQVTVSPETDISNFSVLYNHVNWMLSPFWMAGEAIQGGEIVPPGIIVPEVNWWHKQPFRLVQTTENQTVIAREWWGIDAFNNNLYSYRGG